jgi:hypothetical protein
MQQHSQSPSGLMPKWLCKTKAQTMKLIELLSNAIQSGTGKRYFEIFVFGILVFVIVVACLTYAKSRVDQAWHAHLTVGLILFGGIIFLTYLYEALQSRATLRAWVTTIERMDTPPNRPPPN